MDDHDALENFRIDDEYIDVEPERVEITVEESDYDREDRSEQIPPPHQSVDLSHTFGRNAGDGSQTSLDVEIDAEPTTERDDRGGETGMNTNEAEGHYGEKIIRDGKQRTRAEWLLLLNNGYRSKERKAENERADNQRWIDTFTAELELTDYQKKRTERLIESVNMKHFGSYTVEMIILAAISLATQDDRRMIRDERAFKRLCVEVDCTMKSIRRIRDLLKEKSDLL